MMGAFKGASDTLTEIMVHLKMALAHFDTLNKTVAISTKTNKQLSKTIKTFGGAIKRKLANEKPDNPQSRNQWGAKCPICDKPHKQPFKEYCWEIEANKEQHSPNFQLVLA